jgi:VanZ family protein
MARVRKRTLAAAYLPAFFWAAVVVFIGGMQRPPVPQVPGNLPIDKIGHFLMYFGVGATLAFGWRRAGGRPASAWLLLLACSLGAADEFRQSLMAERTADFLDWMADALGASAGFVVARLLPGRLRRRSDAPD